MYFPRYTQAVQVYYKIQTPAIKGRSDTQFYSAKQQPPLLLLNDYHTAMATYAVYILAFFVVCLFIASEEASLDCCARRNPDCCSALGLTRLGASIHLNRCKRQDDPCQGHDCLRGKRTSFWSTIVRMLYHSLKMVMNVIHMWLALFHSN